MARQKTVSKKLSLSGKNIKVKEVISKLKKDIMWTKYLFRMLDNKEVEHRQVLLAAAQELETVTGYLELGVWKGWSMAVVASATNAPMLGIDRWNGDDVGSDNPGPNYVKEEVAKIGSNIVTLITGDVKNKLLYKGFDYNLALIDAGQSLQVVKDVAENCKGIVVIDDVTSKLEAELREEFPDMVMYGQVGVLDLRDIES